MAVRKSSSKTIGEYRVYYKKLANRLIVSSQILTALSSGMILYLTGFIDLATPAAWASIGSIFIFGIVISFSLYRILAEPLYNILAAMIHKTDELTVTTPPNPNAKENHQTGFDSVLKTIYSSNIAPSGEGSDLAIHNEEDYQNLDIANVFKHTSCGIVILDTDKTIVSFNQAAPVARKQDGEPFLALNFINEQTIMEWLGDHEDKSINAEHRWQRIGTDLRYINKQSFFDIIVSYQKGAAAETIIFLIEQSDRYLPEEEDLNFIAFAAHELRGPTTVIRGYLDVLERELADRLQGDEPELFDRLTVSANRLSSYINNILNVAKLDKHHLRVYLYEDTVYDIYQTISYDMSLRAQAQHRLLSVDIPQNLPTIAADRGSIGEVIGNLIDNAIKYSFEGGSVIVKAEAKGEFVEISVADNGIGMPASVVKNLFKKFYRSHRSRESVAGSGIGLYICKAFVESHGGSMSVRSQEGDGSTFVFTLPIYATVADKLLEDGQLNQSLIRTSGGWIKNHAMYRQ